MAMTNEQLTKWIDEIFGTIDEIKQNSGDISGLTRSVKQLLEDVSDLEDQTAGTVSLVKSQLQHFTDGSATQALDLVADIIPVQAGTGDPSPTNVRAITGYSNVTVKTHKKNYFDGNFESGYYSQIGKVSGTGWKRCADFITVSANTGYVLSGSVDTQGTYESNGIIFYAADGSYIAAATFNITELSFVKTIITPQNCVKIGFYVRENAEVKNVQLEEGSTATTYIAPEFSTATLSLGSTVYSGTVNFTTGALAEDMAVVDLGSLEWTYLSSVHGFNANFPANSGAVKPKGLEGFCEIYKNYADSANPNYEDFITQSYAFWANANDLAQVKKIWIMDDRYTSAEDFTTAMSGVKLCYKLASISSSTTTPAQLQLLQGENNVSATSGPITLTYAPDNVLAEVYAYIQKRFDTLTASLAANRTTRKTTKILTKKED